MTPAPDGAARVVADSGGLRGVCEEVGSGPPLVILASPLARAKTYRPAAASLARSFRVLTLEMPGSGAADQLAGSWSIEQYADWAAHYIDSANLDRPVVVGHSNSGPIAVVLAARHPGLVGRLVVADATGTGPFSPFRMFVGGLCDIVLEIGLVLRAWHHVAGNLPRHPTNFVRQVTDSVTADVRADAARVHVPVLLAWGKRDHTLPPACADEYARHLPDARVHLSPRGSHNWMINRPDEFAAAVAAFAGGR